MKKQKKKAADFARYSAVGFQIVATIFVGIMIGQWLDKKLHTSNNIYTLFGALLMILVALFQIVKMIKND